MGVYLGVIWWQVQGERLVPGKAGPYPGIPSTPCQQHLLRGAPQSYSGPHLFPSAAFCAILQGSLFGQLGTMPSTYSTLFLSGQGLAGIFAALAMVLSMASE